MNTLYNILWIVLALLFQVVLFNHLSVFGGVALVYLIALLKMPVEINRNLQILAGFAVGLCVDIFCNTMGMHALAATTVMWLRIPIMHLYVNAEDVKEGVPSFTLLGMAEFIRYALTLIALHCILLYCIEAFTLFNFLVLLSKIVISVLLSMVGVISLEFATLKK